MPSAANGKAEKPASSEVPPAAADNSPVRQMMTIVEHKIRNLEKRKSKLTSYRDLQKAGKELKADQKVAVAKYDEVAQTLEFARDLSKQMAGVAIVAERDSKKQAKKDAWVRSAAETNKIREVLLIIDCLMQMGTPEVRDDFLNGANGAAKLTQQDLKILDDLYPEVTPKHELNEEGQPGFHIHATKAAEHLYSIIDGKSKEALGTTYAHIKEIVNTVHECGYFDKPLVQQAVGAVGECGEESNLQEEEEAEEEAHVGPLEPEPVYPASLPVPPAPAVVPTPAYPLRGLPPITLQEVEHAYFAQYPPHRPIAEVIGSQNFFFLQESEIDSPTGTPQPPPMGHQSPPAPIPTQTFTNQHYVPLGAHRLPDGAMPLPPGHYAAHGELPPAPYPQAHGELPPFPVSLTGAVLLPHPHAAHVPQAVTSPPRRVASPTPPLPPRRAASPPAPAAASVPAHKERSENKEHSSPELDDSERKTQGQGDGQNRFRRYGGQGGGGGGRGGDGGRPHESGRGRGSSNGYRARSYQNRHSSDSYHRHGNDYQGRSNNDSYGRKYNDGYQGRHKDNRTGDNYYGNGDSGSAQQHGESERGGRERYNNEGQHYQGGFKTRGRGGAGGRGAGRPRAAVFTRKPDHAASAAPPAAAAE